MQDPTKLVGIAAKPSLEQLADEIRSLRRDIAALQTARSGNAMTVDGQPGITVVNGGGITIKDGGAVTVYDVDDHIIGIMGTGNTGNTGIEVARPDGTPSFWAVTSDGGFVALFDRSRNYIVTDDTTSGQGLARPYIPLGVFADNSVPTQTTTSSSFVTLQTLVGYKQHPKITMQLLVYAQSAGEVRVVDQDNNQIGSTVTLAAGAFQYVTVQGAMPGVHMLPISLNVQARITSGTIPIGVRGVAAWGVESSAF